MKDNSDRNRQIAHAILCGESVSIIATASGLSRMRCIQILNGYCRDINRSLYIEISCSIEARALPLKIIMEHADEFLQGDDDFEVFGYSPLYRISQIPNYVIKALGLCGILTVEDLLGADMQRLSNCPMLGKKAIKLIGDFIGTYAEEGLRSGRQRPANF